MKTKITILTLGFLTLSAAASAGTVSGGGGQGVLVDGTYRFLDNVSASELSQITPMNYDSLAPRYVAKPAEPFSMDRSIVDQALARIQQSVPSIHDELKAAVDDLIANAFFLNIPPDRMMDSSSFVAFKDSVRLPNAALENPVGLFGNGNLFFYHPLFTHFSPEDQSIAVVHEALRAYIQKDRMGSGLDVAVIEKVAPLIINGADDQQVAKLLQSSSVGVPARYNSPYAVSKLVALASQTAQQLDSDRDSKSLDADISKLQEILNHMQKATQDIGGLGLAQKLSDIAGILANAIGDGQLNMSVAQAGKLNDIGSQLTGWSNHIAVSGASAALSNAYYDIANAQAAYARTLMNSAPSSAGQVFDTVTLQWTHR